MNQIWFLKMSYKASKLSYSFLATQWCKYECDGYRVWK